MEDIIHHPKTTILLDFRKKETNLREQHTLSENSILSATSQKLIFAKTTSVRIPQVHNN